MIPIISIKRRAAALLLVPLLFLTGCNSREKPPETDLGAQTIVQTMLDAVDEHEETDSLVWYTAADETAAYLSGYYRLEEDSCQDAAIVRMDGARAFELAALRAEGKSSDLVPALQEYLLNRQGSFTGYLPDQAYLAEQALILTQGQWAALIVCEEPEKAKAAFEDCFGTSADAHGHQVPEPDRPPDGSLSEPKLPIGIPEPDQSIEIVEPLPDQSQETPVLPPAQEDPAAGRVPFTNPGKDDMSIYDTSSILAAWRSGDGSSLSDHDSAIFNAAKAVLDSCITPDMDDYHKELALYTWLTAHVSYDRSHYDPQGAPRTSYEPYGPLLDGKGVCLGFASTLQLLLDMSDIECTTVVGAAFSSREDHAWNLVRLNGQWYCADATWDCGPLKFRFNYFNVTSDYMALTDHQWDYTSVPEATATDGGIS